MGGVTRMRIFSRKTFIGCLAIVTTSPVVAQNMPNAGSLLQEIERSTGKTSVAPAPLLPTQASPPGIPLPARSGEKIHVSAFRLDSTLFSEATLQAAIADFTNRELTLADLQAATRRVSEYYRQHDYLAYAYLPPQTVRNGVVEIKVVEARLGKVELDSISATRLDPTLALDLVTRRAPLGEPLRPGRLDQGIAILNELPGVRRAESLLEAGARPGETNARLRIQDSPLAHGSLVIDNTSSTGTGEWQSYLAGSLDNPFGRAEQIQVNGLASEGSQYVRLGGTILLGTSGLRGGVDVSAMQYRVLESVSPLDLNGYSWTMGLSLNYPVLRGSGLSLTASSGFDYKRMVDRMEDTALDDKRIAIGYLGLSLQTRDRWFGGGIDHLAATIDLGTLDLSANPDHQKSDQLTARTQGGFGKLGLSFSREQAISDHVTVSTRIQAQWSPSNLDSSEKLYLGGFSGIRAYPSGEASGDSGWLGNLAVKWQVMDDLQFSGFYDIGWIHQHAAPWTGWQLFTKQPNDYNLQGAGIAIAWSPNSTIQTQAVLAHVIGDNPGSDMTGNDSDGADKSLRAWVQLNIGF